jgi:hypothetical protein
MQPNNPLYNVPRGLRVRGPLNDAALEQALNEIVRRHESQRTTFAVKGGEPVQVIAPSLRIPLLRHDLAYFPGFERESEAQRIATEEAQRPFDLAKGPLLRALLVRMAVDDHVLLLTMHHIVSDAWSAGVFLKELTEIYDAFANGRPSPLHELPIQYADYACWQRQLLSGENLQRQLSYWRERLKGAPEVLNLPTSRPRPKLPSYRGAYDSIPLASDFLPELRRFSQQEDATLFMTLLAGFQALLSRLSGQDQIVVGTDVANRSTTELERLIGFFINLLPLRTNVSGDPTFRELLSRVREVALGAYAHQEVPFEKLVEELRLERSLSHNPLVQVLFVMQNIPPQRRELAGLTLSSFPVPITRSKFDLAVFMVETEDTLIGNWLYSTDLFDRDTVFAIARQFETLLRHAVARPHTRVSALEILSDAEKQQRTTQKEERKQAQLSKLKAAQPRAIGVSSAETGGDNQ